MVRLKCGGRRLATFTLALGDKMRSSRSIAVAIIFAVAATLGLISPSHASVGDDRAANATAGRPPAVVLEYARKMNCKYPSNEKLYGGGPGSGVKCVVKNHVGRSDIYITRYRNVARATDFWRDWVGGSPRYRGWFARKGSVLFIDQDRRDAYNKKWANYAHRKTGARVIGGYIY